MYKLRLPQDCTPHLNLLPKSIPYVVCLLRKWSSEPRRNPESITTEGKTQICPLQYLTYFPRSLTNAFQFCLKFLPTAGLFFFATTLELDLDSRISYSTNSDILLCLPFHPLLPTCPYPGRD